MKNCGCVNIGQKITPPTEVIQMAQNLANKDRKPYAIILCNDWDISCLTVAKIEQIYEIKLPKR
jgi:hypothetical protein